MRASAPTSHEDLKKLAGRWRKYVALMIDEELLKLEIEDEGKSRNDEGPAEASPRPSIRSGTTALSLLL